MIVVTTSRNTDQIIIYLIEDGEKIRLQIVDNDLWMNQKQLSEFFDTSKQNTSNHVKNIFEDRELLESSVVKEYLTTGGGEIFRMILGVL